MKKEMENINKDNIKVSIEFEDGTMKLTVGKKAPKIPYEPVAPTVDRSQMFDGIQPQPRTKKKRETGYQTKAIVDMIEMDENAARERQHQRNQRQIRLDKIKRDKHENAATQCKRLMRFDPTGMSSKERIEAIMDHIPFSRDTLGIKLIPFPVAKVKPIDKLNSEALKDGFILSTPALHDAFSLGILTKVNYNEIKTGGITALEKFSTIPVGIKNCYKVAEEIAKLKERPWSIVRDDEAFMVLVNMKKRQFQMDSNIFERELTTLEELLA